MENIAVLMKQFQTGVGGGGMTDSRGIGRPITFKGEESKYAEWRPSYWHTFELRTPSPTHGSSGPARDGR